MAGASLRNSFRSSPALLPIPTLPNFESRVLSFGEERLEIYPETQQIEAIDAASAGHRKYNLPFLIMNNGSNYYVILKFKTTNVGENVNKHHYFVLPKPEVPKESFAFVPTVSRVDEGAFVLEAETIEQVQSLEIAFRYTAHQSRAS